MSEQESIESGVKGAIAAEFTELRNDGEALTIENICPEDNLFNDLGMDSLDPARLALALQDEFKIEFSDGEEETWQTVSDAISSVVKYMKADEAA